jgi:hypothetical protein
MQLAIQVILQMSSGGISPMAARVVARAAF